MAKGRRSPRPTAVINAKVSFPTRRGSRFAWDYDFENTTSQCGSDSRNMKKLIELSRFAVGGSPLVFGILNINHGSISLNILSKTNVRQVADGSLVFDHLGACPQTGQKTTKAYAASAPVALADLSRSGSRFPGDSEALSERYHSTWTRTIA
ncbi:uncharacterized protein BT62DRAFT_273787 [Guyanagaster necrorhizus]|uniref:Uncharacterized protein n=1 Tax=Guyanagaster necrorhizus TaxID=856835 RepID=A0A9P7W265_9AGAR|nr:uncharacterized protein BT62DRAFT_273787 [Guyanagaster necrorhizus MCA 3950]KAG7451966.1 hypothetical protein BT62DRAFT_273787 [Guyanagaster necrorhizus MCA 3950]